MIDIDKVKNKEYFTSSFLSNSESERNSKKGNYEIDNNSKSKKEIKEEK